MAEALLHHTGNNVISCPRAVAGFIRILPGINSIDSKDLESILNLKSIQARVKDKILVILDDGKKEVKKTAHEYLEMIPKIFDKNLLKKILKTETDQDVLEAAKAQLDAIVPKVDKKAEPDGQHFGSM